MATQQNNDGQSALAIAPSLIVGIVILASFACIIIFASIFRYCRRSQSTLVDPGFASDTGGAEFYNSNKPPSAAQAVRLKEVRWINNMYAWERGRQARMEIGEIRPTTMLMGRRGENKNWDEYSIAGDNSWPNSTGSGNAAGEYSHTPYFNNPDGPCVRSSSQQRLSHLAPPADHVRNSYQSTTSGNGYLPRHPSALLPPPAHGRREALGSVTPKSPLRNEYQIHAEERDLRSGLEAGLQLTGNMVESDPTQRRGWNPYGNPKITISDDSQDVALGRSPTLRAYDVDFETVPLDGSIETAKSGAGTDTIQQNPSKPSPEIADHRPSAVVANDESYPPLKLQFLSQSKYQNSVNVHEGDEVDLHSGPNEQLPMHRAETRTKQHKEQVEDMDESTNGDDEISRENVNGMIQEWERVNGRFGRSYLAAL
ncbi:uncharacterized protein Z519_05146 [Cladophialophora bantiana CBS 173.52]|uniref:Uncharacterized protein n=1 Tax=Cladophialophora bantiana (strain ATCC 10958 / CBS 173.52 / CDC B-1940 / NIH 8579) TaxID=1442370 RepID=A0A0D2EVG9_CLAB1|nr:uncharacterized protein Z519_05146 [Cladophialophora bantiana CBS 173.52]KIW93831.1 hypothetical protein Z519_05146 [Cladophialophora bantiana CBS 173.52]